MTRWNYRRRPVPFEVSNTLFAIGRIWRRTCVVSVLTVFMIGCDSVRTVDVREEADEALAISSPADTDKQVIRNRFGMKFRWIATAHEDQHLRKDLLDALPSGGFYLQETELTQQQFDQLNGTSIDRSFRGPRFVSWLPLPVGATPSHWPRICHGRIRTLTIGCHWPPNGNTLTRRERRPMFPGRPAPRWHRSTVSC